MSRPLAPGDILNLRSVAEVTLHPDGELVAFTISQPDIETDTYRSVIHFYQDGVASQVTYGHDDSTARFSPDGLSLVFVSETPDKVDLIQILQVADRSLRTIQHKNDGIIDVQWLDNDQLVVLSRQTSASIVNFDEKELAQRPRVLTEIGGLKEGPGWITERPATVEVLSLSLPGSEKRSIGDPHFDYASIAVSPDRTTVLAAGSSSEDFALRGHSEVHKLAVAGGPIVVAADGNDWHDPGWTEEGSPFAAVSHKRDALSLTELVLLDSGSSLCGERVSFSQAVAVSNAQVFALAHRRGTVTVDRFEVRAKTATTLIGGSDSVNGGRHSVSAFAVNASGSRCVAAISTPTRPAELWEYREGKLSLLVSLNDELLSELDLVEPEVVQLPSSGGAVVEAFVFRPPPSAPDTGKLRPGLVYIHGGPVSAYELTFFDEFQIAAAAGYVVIAGNPRGSHGYGDEWAEAIRGAVGTVDYDDITAITDHLDSMPEVDSTRIGIGGGSYGGMMTAWMISHSDRYKAALVERCVSNLVSFIGTSDIGGFFPLAFNGTTLEADTAELLRQSPLTYAAQTSCPVLVIHSDSDWRCPLEQGTQLFAAYRRNNIDASMVIFPGENHELSRSGSPKHRVERFGFIHDFYAKHLGVVSFPASTDSL